MRTCISRVLSIGSALVINVFENQKVWILWLGNSLKVKRIFYASVLPKSLFLLSITNWIGSLWWEISFMIQIV